MRFKRPILPDDLQYLKDHKKVEKGFAYHERFGEAFPPFNYEERRVNVKEYISILDHCLAENKTLKELGILDF